MILFIILIALLNSIAYSQVKDWDDVSLEELEMSIYLPDSNASAVVLFDKAEVDFNKNLEYVLERHVRIKILREEGYEWAQAEIIFNDEMDQDVSRIRGHTFTLNEDGEIEKHKLDGDSIFEEDMYRDYKRIRFTLPALEPGAVAEYKYRMHVGSPYLLPDWEFQKSIPVAWSEYSVRIPDWFFYNKMLIGTHPIHIQESNPFSERMRYTFKQTSGFYTRKTDYQNAYIDVRGDVNRWVMKDIPAVRELPYMTSVDDYKSKLWMQLTEIRFPRQVPQYFLKSWSDVAEELREIESFGGQLKSRSEFRTAVNELIAGSEDSFDRMQAIYDYVSGSIVWDGMHGILSDNDIVKVWETRKGSGAEINLLLTQLLRDSGLKADPVLISTRGHGKIFQYSAMVNQFNHVIAYVTIGEDSYLLDATSPNTSVNMLPIKDLNGRGLLVGKDSEKWVKLESRVPTKRTVTMNAELTETGLINAEVNISSEGHNAIKDGIKLKNEGESDYIESLFNDHFEKGVIDSFHVDAGGAEKEHNRYKLFVSNGKTTFSQRSGDLFYFNPTIFLKEEENPFPQPERDIPVDFPHLFEKSYVANFVVPKGYTIEQVPEPKILTIPGGTAELRRLTQVNNNWITVVSKLKIKKKTFSPEEYHYLRDFYNHVVDTHNEQIVLRAAPSSSNSN